MKYKIILYGLIAALATGCSSAYKASQTPDDVYFSPARKGTAQKNVATEDRYEDYQSMGDDQYLRMKIRNRDRWSTIDDYTYWNDSRYVPSYSYGYYTNNWNNAYSWNNPYAMNNWNSPFYYNPLYSGGYGFYGSYYPQLGYSSYNNGYISNGYLSKYSVRSSSNVGRPSLNAYRSQSYNNTNANAYYRQGLGSSIKRVFSPNENNNGYNNRNLNNRSINTNNNTFRETYRAPERSYTPSSSGSSSSGGAISRPGRH